MLDTSARRLEIARVDIKCFGQPTDDGYACRDTAALDRANVAHAEFCACCQFLLRQALDWAQATHVDG